MAHIETSFGSTEVQYSGWGAILRKLQNLLRHSTYDQISSLDAAQDNITELVRVDAVTKRKLKNSTLYSDETFGEWHVHIVAPANGGFRSHVSYLKNVSSAVMVHSSWETALKCMRSAKPYSFIAIVDVDLFETNAEAVDALLEFRSQSPMVPIIIGSRTFKYDDLSTERSPIADASIKLPVSKVGIGMALNTALENHKYVVERDLSRSRVSS